jgi:hypothetical protein
MKDKDIPNMVIFIVFTYLLFVGIVALLDTYDRERQNDRDRLNCLIGNIVEDCY